MCVFKESVLPPRGGGGPHVTLYVCNATRYGLRGLYANTLRQAAVPRVECLGSALVSAAQHRELRNAVSGFEGVEAVVLRVVVVVLETTRPLDSPTYGVDSRWVVCKLRTPQWGAVRLSTHSQTSILPSVLRISALRAPCYPHPTPLPLHTSLSQALPPIPP